MQGRDVRLSVVTLFVKMQTEHGSLSTLMPAAERQVAPAERSLFKALCFGLARHYYELNALITPLLKKPLKKKDADLVLLMQLGVLQIEYMNIPSHAAVDLTVGVTKALKKPWARGLVNAVLRNFIRQRDTLIKSLSVSERVSFPSWLYQAIEADWPSHVEEVIANSNAQAPMVLRVNQMVSSTSEYLHTLESVGMAAEAHAMGASAVVLKVPVDVRELPGFNDGVVSVQDAAAQLAAPMLKEALDNGQEKLSILDACAAPGGKTTHLLECLPAAELTVLDVSQSRLERVRESLARLKLEDRATLVAADAVELTSWWDYKKFDAVLLDAPCSGTGVIRRHPDIKLLRRAEDIDALTKLQSDLLSTLWNTVKPGGLLLYATCSLLKRENTQIVEAFLDGRTDVQPKDLSFTQGVAQPVGRQLLPGSADVDGFYYALLKKLE